MEIKPADNVVIDHRDMRYRKHNNITNKWMKDMDKKAYINAVTLVLDKQTLAERERERERSSV